MILSGLPVISLCNTWGLLVVNGVKLSVGFHSTWTLPCNYGAQAGNKKTQLLG